MLAKTAEERYQTAAGLEADPRRALAESESGGNDAFPLGTRDLSERAADPEVLYGREREMREPARHLRPRGCGGPELVLVVVRLESAVRGGA